MRVVLENHAILERARLALVGVEHDIPRRWLGAHEPPFAVCREARATEASESRRFRACDDIVHCTRALYTLREQLVSAARAVTLVVDGIGRRGRDLPVAKRTARAIDGRLVHGIATDHGDRCVLAPADTRRRDHSHVGAFQPLLQLVQQAITASDVAGDRFAHADRERSRRDAVVLYDVEVVIERRDLENFGGGEPHLPGKCSEVRRCEKAEMVLQFMQVLDQQVAPAGLGAEKLYDFSVRLWFYFPALGCWPEPQSRICAATRFAATGHEKRGEVNGRLEPRSWAVGETAGTSETGARAELRQAVLRQRVRRGALSARTAHPRQGPPVPPLSRPGTWAGRHPWWKPG